MPDFLGQISGFVLYEDHANATLMRCKNYPPLDIKEATLYKSQHDSDDFFEQAI